jgi:hypothetical protein
LLSQCACQDYALLFTAGDLVHPTITEMLGPNLSKSIFGDGDVVFCLEAKRAAIGMATLQHEFPRPRRKQQAAFLLD